MMPGTPTPIAAILYFLYSLRSSFTDLRNSTGVLKEEEGILFFFFILPR